MSVINGLDVATRERVFDPDDKASQAAFWAEVHATPTWKRFMAEFGNSDENNETFIGVLNKLHGDGGEFYSVSQCADALEVAMNSGALLRKPVAPAAVATPPAEVPRDRNGRPLTKSQILWAEHTRFANEHSAKDCHDRARVDAGFASFVRTNLEREIAQPIDGAIVPEGERTGNVPRVSPGERERLVRFAQDFNALPVAEARKKLLRAYNPEHAAFQSDFEKCRSLRLL